MNLNDQVPDFSLPDQHGRLRSLSELTADGPAVIFFYPKAGSGGCTKEACHFRDLAAEFAAVGAAIVGISHDSVAAQLSFAQKNHYDFPLLSDRDGEVADVFGVRRRLLSRTLPAKRATFIVDGERRLRFVTASETNMLQHADTALAALRNGV